MSNLAEVVRLAHTSLVEKYGHLMHHEHHYALKQIMQCHTPDAGAMCYSIVITAVTAARFTLAVVIVIALPVNTTLIRIG
ncbi:hypothetical protein PPRY_a0240 [Pseudoalteromonas prydzensis ACAM 620]|uniref:hypothetical protein n=1 Tax=Pseudoalteromonas prydzensis TaxID=182141 RepID=UPI0007E50B16|nr:hypothetical protein [Pseudoalteromonas prydzensis]MBE0377680.1 hypothetical protein [Pseudoalteromonas prydzensis ACAM 620]